MFKSNNDITQFICLLTQHIGTCNCKLRDIVASTKQTIYTRIVGRTKVVDNIHTMRNKLH